MNLFIPGLIIVFATVGCGQNQSASHLHDTTVESYYDELGMRPGVGLDTILHDVRGECVEFEGLANSGNSQEAIYSFRLIEGHRELFSSMGVSPAMQVRAAILPGESQISPRAQFTIGNAFTVSQYSVYLLASARIRNETQFLKSPRVRSDAAQLMKQGVNGLAAFRRKCGDSFMVGSSNGAEFYALMEIETESDEELRKLRSSLGQDISGSDHKHSEAQLSGQLHRLSRQKNMHIWTFQRGGAGEAEAGMVQTTSEVMARLKSLADSARAGQNPRALTATFSDYLTLGLEFPSSHLQSLRAAQDVIEDLGTKLGQLLDIKADLNYVLAHPSRFAGINGAKLASINHALSQIDEQVQIIRSSAKGCTENFQTCRLNAEFKLPTVELPKRRRNLAQLENEKLSINTIIHYLNVNAISDSFSQPECYMQINIGRHGDDRFITALRTETDYGPNRCRNLQSRLELSMELVRDAFAQLGIRPDQGWIELQLYEDDPWYPDLLGSTYISFSQLDSGAVIKGIHNGSMNLQVNFELRD
jgi:hypothetical protein